MAQNSPSKGFVWSPELGATIITVLVLIAIPATLFLTNKSQDTRQRASNGARVGTMSIDPSNGIYSKGQTFAVNLLINGNGEEFNTAKATVGTTNNLEVKSVEITPLSANGCAFSFLDNTPNLNNLSFNGLSFDRDIKNCSLYTITLVAKDSGNATVFITNGEIISSVADKNILESVKSANFTITP